jgi:photosystem II stability/assembly factor-like uncharacterized protein
MVGTERASQRRRRAAVLIALALSVIIAASLTYLRPTFFSTPKQASLAVNLSLLTTDFIAYDFVSPSVGWALDFPVGPSSKTGQFIVFRTVDAAKHWLKQLTGQSQFCGFSPFAVHFLDQLHGFIAVRCPTEQLYRTTDGGAHWDSVALPSPQVEVITFSDPSNGWLLAQPTPTSGQVRNLYATRDAGNTWQPLPDPPPDAYELNFSRPSEALMAGYGPGRPHVYTSTDMGQSWQRHDLPPPPGGSWDSGSYFPPSLQLLPGAGALASVDSQGPSAIFLFTSFDGGTTWRYVPAPPGLVAYQDTFDWWAIKATVLFKSSDAGQTWTEVTNKLADWQYLPQILDSKHAWSSLSVLGGYGLAFTDDGGLHWTRATVPQLG